MTPTDRWLVCGHEVAPLKKNRGCTCNPYDPTPLLVQEAIRRLAAEGQALEGGRHAGSPPHA